MDILDSHNFALPQRRCRLFIVAVRRDAQVAAYPYQFPQAAFNTTRLSQCIKVLPPDKWQPHPPAGTQGFSNMMKELVGMETQDFNAWEKAVCIDVGCSLARSRSSIEEIGTLTATGCSRHDYWVTTKGGALDIHDMECCQGMRRGVFNLPLGVSICQYAHMIGNSISWNVLAGMAPMAFLSAGLCSPSEHAELASRWKTFCSLYP